MSAILTYPEAIILGAFQGVTELFPVSSLGHSVLIPALIGGSWKNLDVTAKDSPYLAFIVGMHVATAIAMIIYFWRDWLRIIKGFFGSFSQITSPAPGTGRFEFRDTDQKLAWMIILGTIPVGLAGVVLDHPVRTVLAKPIPTAVFLTLNGLLLLGGEMLRRRRKGLDDQQSVGGRQAAGVDAAGGWSGASQGNGVPDGRGEWAGRGGQGGYDQRGSQGGYDQRGGQAGFGDRGYDQRGGQPGGPGDQGYRDQGYRDQGYGDRGYRDQGPGNRGDQGGYDSRGGYGSGSRRDEPWGNDQRGGYSQRGGRGGDQWGNDPGYDSRGDHGGLGPRGYGDGSGFGNDPWGSDQQGGSPRRDDPWGSDQRGFNQQGGGFGGDPRGGDPRGGDPRGGDQRGRNPRGGAPWEAPRGNSQPGGYDQQGGHSQPAPHGSHRAGRHGAGQPVQRPASGHHSVKDEDTDRAIQADQRLVKMSWLSAIGLGAAQILALFPGFSRDGSVMVAGLVRGLSRQDAVRFSFLLSAPVILAAGVFKASELLGPETKGIHGQIFAGMIVAGVCAYFALMFLDRFLSNPKRTLTPFAVYCLVMGLGSLIYLH